MALQLMKLQITATTTTEVTPEPEKFFFVTTTQTEPDSTLTINPDDFFQDDGTEATELPVLEEGNSYYKVYINGVLQMEGLTTYTAGAPTVGSLAIAVPEGDDPILANTPIVLEVMNYDASSETTVET
ncbi:DUF4183 domain-containing protein [Alteribacter populi]|uniref:DUF4183 domain-containing protein n=1 Tax=Alteribacter populi TaxID=2011011 RepID=UPI000BBB22F7|nr:DUF4183 domain-containing protein [Alteribacter populi]